MDSTYLIEETFWFGEVYYRYFYRAFKRLRVGHSEAEPLQ